jgi:hypothetical protein
MAPESVEFFYDHYLRKARFHVKSADPDRAVPLLPWSTINRLIEGDVFSPKHFRLVRANNAVDPAMYRKRGDDGFLRAGVMQNLLRQGSSLILDVVDDLVPSIGRLTAALERELSSKVWGNAYLTFGTGNALAAHYDLHDVMILQVYGRKHWRCYGVPVAHPVERFDERWQAGDAAWEHTLEPGDILYLPRGEIHAATVERGHSVHLTIAFASSRGLDFAKATIKEAAKDALFRQDIPIAAGELAIKKREAALKKSLHALIDRADLSSYLASDNRARRLRPLMNLGMSGPYHADMIIEPAVRRRIPLDIEIEGDLDISIGEEKFRLSAAARRVLEFLLRHDESTFGAIVSALGPRLSGPSVQDAVQELAEQSLVGIRI